MRNNLRRVSAGFMLAFFIVGLTAGYWSLVRRDALLIRDDNPRRVLDEQSIQRGAIYDRHGEVLVHSSQSDDGVYTRQAVHPSVASITGYYSLRFGTSGLEAAHISHLRGEDILSPNDALWADITHQTTVGGDIQTTLDLSIQTAAYDALAPHTGAVVVMDASTGELLAAVSNPSFDPSTLDADWDALSDNPAAPLLNRVTQGLYQPGSGLQSVIAAILYDLGEITNDRIYSGPRLPVTIDEQSLECVIDSNRYTGLDETIIAACPGPLTTKAGAVLQQTWLETTLQDFGLLTAPVFELPSEAADITFPLTDDNYRRVLAGQGDLTITPLQMALATGVLANQGRYTPPTLVMATRPPDGAWTATEATSHPVGVVSPQSAAYVDALWAAAVERGSGRGAGRSGMQVLGHGGLALSGPEGVYHVWFVGYTLDGNGHPIVITTLLENTSSVSTAAALSGDILSMAVTP